MNAATMYQLNLAVSMLNINRNRARRAWSNGDRTTAARYARLAAGWESRTRTLATLLGVQLVPMTDNPRALVVRVPAAMLVG